MEFACGTYILRTHGCPSFSMLVDLLALTYKPGHFFHSLPFSMLVPSLTLSCTSPGPVHALSWSPTGRHLATASTSLRGDALQIWDIILQSSHVLKSSPGVPSALAWAPTGSHLFAAFQDTLSVWETSRWGCEHFDFPGVCTAVAWSPDGQRVAVSVSALEAGDLVWVSGEAGEAWAPATVLAVSASAATVALHTATGEPGETRDVPRADVHGDRPILVGRLQQRTADTAEFSLSFESAFLPSFEAELADLCDGAPQLPSSAVTDLAWSPDGAQLLASFRARSGGRLYTALGTYVVNSDPLSLSPGALLDLRERADDNSSQLQGAGAFWVKGTYRGRGFVVAAGMPQGADLMDRGAERRAGIVLYQ